jgi:hypothetical protein
MYHGLSVTYLFQIWVRPRAEEPKNSTSDQPSWRHPANPLQNGTLSKFTGLGASGSYLPAGARRRHQSDEKDAYPCLAGRGPPVKWICFQVGALGSLVRSGLL